MRRCDPNGATRATPKEYADSRARVPKLPRARRRKLKRILLPLRRYYTTWKLLRKMPAAMRKKFRVRPHLPDELLSRTTARRYIKTQTRTRSDPGETIRKDIL